MFTRLAIVLPVAASLMATSAAAACFEPATPGATAEGSVAAVNRRHPNGTQLAGYVINLQVPVCLKDPDALQDVSRVRRLHVIPATPKDAAVLQGHVGKRVRVTGSPISGHTAYHFEPIVLLDSTVVAKSP